MEKGNLIPSEFESDMVNRLAALVAQKLSEPAGLSKPNYEEAQLPNYSKVSPILANSTEALRIIKDAEIRERDGIKRQIVKIANRLAFTVNSNEQIGSEETIDVVLKKNKLTIACFVFNCGHLSCGPKFIEQCTKSNFDSVIVCTSGNDNFDRIGTLLGATFRKISVVQLSALTNYLAGLGCNTLRKEFSFKGRKVTIEYKRLSEEDAELKSNAIKRVLLKGISK